MSDEVAHFDPRPGQNREKHKSKLRRFWLHRLHFFGPGYLALAIGGMFELIWMGALAYAIYVALQYLLG